MRDIYLEMKNGILSILKHFPFGCFELLRMKTSLNENENNFVKLQPCAEFWSFHPF